MIIPSQLPQIVTAARSGALQALALQAGQVLDGRVIGPAPNGATQVQIQGQLLNLVLPQAAAAGDALRFEVQGSGAQLRLALQVATAKPQTAPASAASPSAAPATSSAGQTAPAAPALAATAGSATSAPPAPAPGSVVTTGPAGTGQAIPTNTASANVTPANAASPSTPAATSVPSPPPVQPAVNQPTPGAGPAPLPPASPTGAAAPAVVNVGQTTPATASPAASAPLQGAPSAAGPTTAPAPGAQAAPRPVTPYAAAAPAGPGSSGTPTTGTATTAAAAGTKIPSAPPLPNVAPAPIPTVTAAMPSTPEAALAQMVQAALPRQNSVVSLTTALAGIAGKVALPEPVARAAQQVLANQLVFDGGKVDGSALQRGVLNSGIFQEAALARAGTPLLAPQADMKASLLALRQTLTTWLGQQPALVAAVSQMAPPLRGKTLRTGAAEIPPIAPVAGAEEIGKHLLDRTESALSRIRLHQHASLPDPTLKGADWSTDLPVVIAGQQTLLQLQIHRDEHNPAEEASERGWQMRFAINLPSLGEVGAQVSLRGKATGVMLWASEDSTAAALEADIDGLRDTLAGAGLAPGAVIVRRGAPPASQQPANAGHLVDARR